MKTKSNNYILIIDNGVDNMNDTLSKIKQFESQLKEILIHEYGRFLPTERVNLLKATNYTTNDLLRDEPHKSKTFIEENGFNISGGE